MSTHARSTLRELRRTRQRRRLGETDWYDVAYRVYLFGLGGLTAVVIASDAVSGVVGADVDTADLWARGPAVLGIAVALALAAGLRSGADGGPVSIEVADIRHVLLAPISRRMVMLRPITQRLRSVVFALGVGSAILGQLVATELAGSRAAWAASCGLFGALVGAVFVATAVIAHAIGLPRWAASVIGSFLVLWQALAAWSASDPAGGPTFPAAGPADLAGRLGLWGIDQRPVDLVAVAVVAVMVAVALGVGGRLRLEPLERRGELVSQLRFAATVQDLRTVVLLRRQLRSETLRARPWGSARGSAGGSARGSAQTPRRGAPSPAGERHTTATRNRSAHVETSPTVVWRRGVRSLRRLPASRIVRVVLLAVAGGAAASLTYSSSPLFGLGLLAAVFVVGLESVEPLSQEVDRPDLTDSLLVERGWLFAHHLVAPAMLLVAVAVVGAVTATVIDPNHAAAAFAVAVPVAWAGALGPIVATVLDAPPPLAASATTILGSPRHTETSLVPPEFAGFSTALRALLPVVISAAGTVPIFVLRAGGDAATLGRVLIAIGLFTAAVVWWIRRRDPWGVKIRAFFAEGRAAAT
jgi:hypothetical protein